MTHAIFLQRMHDLVGTEKNYQTNLHEKCSILRGVQGGEVIFYNSKVSLLEKMKKATEILHIKRA